MSKKRFKNEVEVAQATFFKFERPGDSFIGRLKEVRKKHNEEHDREEDWYVLENEDGEHFIMPTHTRLSMKLKRLNDEQYEGWMEITYAGSEKDSGDSRKEYKNYTVFTE